MKEISIFFTTDDCYVPMLKVTLNSIIKFSNKKYIYNIFIVYSKLTNNNKEVLQKFNKKNFKINLIDINKKLCGLEQKFFTRDYYSYVTYYRILLPNMFRNIDKALYLDCDIVLNDDVAKLYNFNIKDNLLGAVSDESVGKVDEFKNYVKDYLGINPDRYFNAGVLIMNFKQLRKINIEKRFINLLDKIKFIVAQDQDYLNVLCKNRVMYLPHCWNKMSLDESMGIKDVKLIHYNLNFKPWRYDNISYEKEFWENAKEANIENEILLLKRNFSDELKQKDFKQGENLKQTAKCLSLDKVNSFKTLCEKGEIILDEHIQDQSIERLNILKKIEYLEEHQLWDKDVEQDPPTIPLKPQDVDYINKKLSSKMKTSIANFYGKKFFNKLLKEKQYIFNGVEGLEKLKDVKGGAIITCNHFNMFDNYAVYLSLKQYYKKLRLYKIVREGNYSFTGKIGFFMKNCNSLPLSQNPATMMKCMRAVDTLLSKGEKVLIYPEQAMWWNYKKPRPLKDGAYKFAVRNNVPVIPLFITLEDSNLIDKDGFPVQKYTVHIQDIIYENPTLSNKENIEQMKEKNFNLNKQTYERVYKIPLCYNTEKKQKLV